MKAINFPMELKWLLRAKLATMMLLIPSILPVSISFYFSFPFCCYCYLAARVVYFITI